MHFTSQQAMRCRWLRLGAHLFISRLSSLRLKPIRLEEVMIHPSPATNGYENKEKLCLLARFLNTTSDASSDGVKPSF